MTKLPYNRTYFLALYFAVLTPLTGCVMSGNKVVESDRQAAIFPEYYDLTLPPNIAPLNFIMEEPGSRYRVEISAPEGKKIVIKSRSPLINIPEGPWHQLLEQQKGGQIRMDIWAKQGGTWIRFQSLTHLIAREEMDPYLAYRLVHATYLKWYEMGIYQRNISSFEENAIIENADFGNGCVNCHSFALNDPSRMMLHFRINHAGTVLWNGDSLMKVDTKVTESLSAGIYPAWHPDGDHIAFSTGKISPHLTTRFNKVVDVADRESDLVIYDIRRQRILSNPAVSTSRRENMPVWSPDGRTLYFISAPEAEEGDDETLLHSRYSLHRIPFSTGLNQWGEVETILDADSVGMSMSMPALSPDGRYMLCSMSDYGYFTIFHRQSDIYCIDMQSREYRRLELNSGEAESWSAWSTNGRWIIFSSKRMDGVYSRPHLAYFDEQGRVHSPFVLPQKDPSVYERILANFNLPKPITGKVLVPSEDLLDVVTGKATKLKP